MKKKKRIIFRKSFLKKLLFVLILAIIAVIAFSPLFIEINGDREITIEVFDQYEELGAKTVFGSDCKITGEVDTNTVGKYKIKYHFLSETITRTVNVVDTTAPVIEVDDFDNVYVYINSDYQPAQASAKDNYDGDLSELIEIDNNVDVTKIGDYQVIYTVSDSSNNKAEKIINVHVSDQDSFFNKKTGDINTKALETIKKFINSYHKSLKYLAFDDCSDLFENNEYFYIYKNLHNFIIDVRKNAYVSMYLSDASYDLNIVACEEKEYGYYVKLYETYSQTYAYCDDNTAKHEIYCRYKLSDDFKIISFYREESVYYSYLDGYSSCENYKEEVNSFINKVKTKYERTHNDLLEQLEKVNSGVMTIENTITKTAKYGYDREKAAAYAIKYALNQNTDYHYFPDGNCVNFCSQAMYAGGIRMVSDGAGASQWKYYDFYVNHQEGQEGYTLSWCAIYYFMRFAKNQNSFVIQTCVSPFLAEKGDMLLFAQDSETYNHAVLVTKVIKDEDGKILDIIYCGSTNNVENGSFWASVTGYMELEKIIGSN